MKYVCDICGYVYDPEVGDPENGVAPGTPWEEVPEDWVCPLCSVGKDQFSPEEYAITQAGEKAISLLLFCASSKEKWIKRWISRRARLRQTWILEK